MGFFQNSVINKYLATIETQVVSSAYLIFKEYFHNPERQQNIRDSKEEQFQEGFLRELFVKILGYTLNPDPAFNLTTEYKNIKDSKKADGAVILDGVVIAVIELKGTDTTDLSKIENQAFGYKNNQPDCVYVITSNFEKIRFYIDNAIEHIEFNLFTLTENEFFLLWLCLAYENIRQNLPKRIKEESLSQEDEITKKLYRDYSLFKRELYQNLVALNPQFDPLTLFKKSQKLLDRLLFLFFAEDRLLLPPNSVRLVLNDWRELQDRDVDIALYERFKKYFGYLNTGFKGKRYDVFAYNGGLFKPDEILDTIKINDELLFEHTKKLSDYDFASEVDVNILGHIFENSLNELDEIKAQLEGIEIDKSKTKRKKDGVFYTPKYITKYIIENTIGRLCIEKKAKLQLKEEDYTTDRKRQIKTKQVLLSKLTDYRTWLLQLTVCDPACGSGAFLNQALDFLINEHKYIDELQAKLLGESMVLSDLDKTILENNLFGVDLNEESVEIARLSLWLRTARTNRKLNDLSNNIKCGNSLIDDPSVAGDKAFIWQQEFPQVFEKGGFDVVVGNPPYVGISSLPKNVHKYFERTYEIIHTGYNDLMYYFLFKGIMILNEQGTFGMITSNYFIGNEYARALRCYLSKHISLILNFQDYLVFEDANVHTAVIFADKDQKSKTIEYNILTNTKSRLMAIDPIHFKQIKKDRNELTDYWIFAGDDKELIIKKLLSNGRLLGQIAEIEKGSTSGKNDVFTISKEVAKNCSFEKELLRKNVKNGDILRYGIFDRDTFLIYTDNNTEIEKYPNILNYLKEHKEELSQRNEVKNGLYQWWRLERPRRKEIYDAEEKIIVPYRATNNRFAYDTEKRFNDGGDIRVLVIREKELSTKYVLGILNSNLIDWYYGFIGKPKGNSREYFNEPLAKIPIFIAGEDIQTSFTTFVDQIIRQNIEIRSIQTNFTDLLQSKFKIERLSNKLIDWHTLEFKEFLQELKKSSIKLSLQEEANWMQYFNEQRQRIEALKEEIVFADNNIDRMVYNLYGLTNEEIKIIEAS